MEHALFFCGMNSVSAIEAAADIQLTINLLRSIQQDTRGPGGLADLNPMFWVYPLNDSMRCAALPWEVGGIQFMR